MDKDVVVAAILAEVSAELAVVERVAAMARDEVSSEETKQEGKYDTRATEASYLARGQAWRVAELRRLRAWFAVFEPTIENDTVTIGSLVELDGPRPGWVFVAPIGGPSVMVGDQSVRVISPKSPLGSALAECREGDAVEVESPQGPQVYEVVSLV